jgi:titin
MVESCALFLILLASLAGNAQVPSTSTVQNGGTPNAANPQVVSNYTVPRAGIVLGGTALNAQGFPVRHLWVGDNVMGFCRVDPDLDTPGIRVINPNTCPFKLNGLSLVGGPAAYDPATNFVYIADARRSLGIFRLKYDPTADGGHGNIDLTSIFGLAGNVSGARFQGGQTGCPFPNAVVVGGVALGPDGNLWATQGKGGSIIRINNPANADVVGFGSCADFVQVVASSPDGRTTGDLAWIGHDFWSVDGTSPFVIANADTTCQAFTPGMTPTCTAINQLATVGAANTTGSDQVYPYLNGNNLYYGLSAVVVAPTAPGQLFWVADVTGAQTVDSNFINPADIAASLLPTQASAFPLGAMSQSTVDYVDPANLIVYTGDDPSNNGITIPPTISGAPGLGLGRWWQSCQGAPPVVPDPFATNVLGVNNCPTPAASAIPGVPTVARAKAFGSQITVSWSPAQSNQPVTSYRLRTLFNGVQQAPDTFITAAPGAAFPLTHKTFSGVANGSYSFQVSAINGVGESGFSALSSPVSVPEIDVPGIPTRVTAIAGNASALVSWFAPAQAGGAPISSYTVTVIRANIRTATTVTVAAPDTSAVITGLLNGTSYSFTVHANNAGGSSLESTASNSITPAAAAAAVVVGVTGPQVPDQQFLPGNVTFNVTVRNTTTNPISNAAIVATLTQAVPDGAFIFFAQPTQGSCGAGGPGILIVSCQLGTLNALSTATINVIVTIKANTATLDIAFSGTDVAANPVSALGTFTLPTPPPPSPTPSVTAAVSVTGNAQVPVPNVGQAGNIVWTISDTTQTTASNVIFQANVPTTGTRSMQLNSITVTENNSGTFVCTFTPTGGSPVPCASAPVGTGGGTILVTTPSLGGSTKNGAKPPQTLIVTVNVTNPAGTTRGTVFTSTGTMTFGPGGVDTLPNSATVKITSN